MPAKNIQAQGGPAFRAPVADAPTSSPKSARESKSRECLLTPKEVADILRVSLSWLAKARMRGDGPPFVPIGRSIRYPESALQQWTRSRMRFSTSET